MPNLKQNYALKKRYFDLSSNETGVQDYLNKMESRQFLKKAFETDELGGLKRETRLFAILNENLTISKPGLIEYFDQGKTEDVVLLFIDITSFSKTISGLSNTQLKAYLDDYYEQIIPIIYQHGGEIEKLMGDGIICVFGKPFLDLDHPDYVYKAEACAEEVIRKLYNTDKNVKVAIHKGDIQYYKVPGDHYGEYTIIGQPLTDIFRLESISKPNSINFYSGSTYDRLGWVYSKFDEDDMRTVIQFSVEQLTGISFENAKYMIFKDL